jgi:alpha-beta hydrolase superfamily lysophospholipase
MRTKARLAGAVVLALIAGGPRPVTAAAETVETITLRGHPQTVRLYGARGGTPVVVTSGDGGWIHLGPHVAEALAARGYFVVGVDARAYLSSFTAGGATLRPEDEPDDFRALAEFAARGSARKPILIGVSEGAGLSLLAATGSRTRDAIAGVVGLGLPETNELGWRWRDAVIYVTHGTPNEPCFSATRVAPRVAPLPFAAIHSSHDEFVPLTDVRRVVAAAGEPKRLWVVDAADHRFSDALPELDRRLLEALAWIGQHGPDR